MKAAFKIVVRFSICMVLLLTTSGCWDSSEIQKSAYVTALGIDYVDNEFIIYSQILNFSNIAKNEQSTLGKEVPVWIGKGTGQTVMDALDNIVVTLEMDFFLGHLKAVICSERLMNSDGKFEEVYDHFNRQRDVRYNILTFGTREDLREVLTQKSVLNLSPIDSSLIQYDMTYRQGGYVQPIHGFKVIAALNEPGRTLLLPSLSITEETWSEDKKPKGMLKVNGAFIMDGRIGHQYKGLVTVEQMLGSRWLQKELVYSEISVPKNEHPKASIVLSNPDFKITVDQINEDIVTYRVIVKLQGSVVNMMHEATIHELEAETEEAVRKEIVATYKYALARNIDILSLNGVLYRSHPKVWKKFQANKSLGLSEDSLSDVVVKVDLIHTGKYKGRSRQKMADKDD